MSTPPGLKKIFQYSNNNDNYDIQLDTFNNALSIAIVKNSTVPIKRYENQFSLEELIAKSKWFRIFDTITEVDNEICSLLTESKYKLQEESNFITFSFSTSIKSTDEIQLTIIENDIKKEEDTLPELCDSLNQISKSLDVLVRKFHIVENSNEFKKYFSPA